MPGQATFYPDFRWRGRGLNMGGALQSGFFFEMPTNAALQGSDRKVWAHYMPFYSMSIDNDPVGGGNEYYEEVFMPPGGAAYESHGGFIRDRPEPRPVRPEPSAENAWPDFSGGPYWQVLDAEYEIDQAYRMGLDGFVLLFQGTSTSGDKRQGYGPYYMLQACENYGNGMKMVLMPDVSVGSVGGLTATGLAQEMAYAAAYDSAYRLPDGRLVIMVYKAESGGRDAAWWDGFTAAMLNNHGEDIAFWPSFTDAYKTTVGNFIDADNLYGLTTWGNSHATGNPVDQSSNWDYPYGQGKHALDNGFHWCMSGRLQDHRPHSGVYWEPEGSKNYRNTWEIARQLEAYNSAADWVQLTTWNDFAEGSNVNPAYINADPEMIQLTAYFTAWFKTKVQPPILKDAIFLFHRPQKFHTNVTSTAQTEFMTRLAGTANYEFAEALVFATAPGDVTLDSGANSTTVAVPAGMSVVTVALDEGTQTATLERNSSTVLTVSNPLEKEVLATPLVQDYTYWITYGVAA